MIRKNKIENFAGLKEAIVKNNLNKFNNKNGLGYDKAWVGVDYQVKVDLLEMFNSKFTDDEKEVVEVQYFAKNYFKNIFSKLEEGKNLRIFISQKHSLYKLIALYELSQHYNNVEITNNKVIATIIFKALTLSRCQKYK